jgi:ubiquinone/menaquinone biosynthesis C-methylase UbiE
MADDAFSRFEHEGWQRVADKYDSVWASSTRQFIPPLLDAAEVEAGMRVLDIGCGPGYVAAAAAARGAHCTGLDFSSQMIGIARKLFPALEFRVGDAQQLPFTDAGFDRVLTNFALLHVSDPERACAEACRVLKSGGKLAFSVWAPPAENPYATIIDDALDAHADFNVALPQGPSHYLYSGKEAFREALMRAGFDGGSMVFKLHLIEWVVPNANFVFEAERYAGVRTAGLLARQTPEALDKIRRAIERAVQQFVAGDKFAVPKSAYIVTVTKTR